jgi:hypothetical protein
MQINDFKAIDVNMEIKKPTKSIAQVLDIDSGKRSAKVQQSDFAVDSTSKEVESKNLSEILRSDTPVTQAPTADTNIIKRRVLSNDNQSISNQDTRSKISQLFENLRSGKISQNDVKTNLGQIFDNTMSNLGLLVNKYA